jgi:HEAT repeat protein
MPQSSATQKSAASPGQSTLKPAALDTAFEALRVYDQGSSRGALLPIDEAVMTSFDDKQARKELERQLVTTLKAGGAAAAREYICSKLALIGSEFSLPALAAQLSSPEFATAARNAFEAIPDRQATKALRDSLSMVESLQKVGVIHSLGARRDADSVRALTALLKNEDARIVGAAVAALGNIANSKAAKALRDFQPMAPEALRQSVADAVLNCAERLLAAGKRSDAQTLYRMLATIPLPNHVQHAAARGLELASEKK